MHRKSYHTSIKLAVKLDILPESIKQMIPPSTLYRFIHSDYSSVFGMALCENLDNKLEIIKHFARHEKAIRIYKTLLNAYRIITYMYTSITSLPARWWNKIKSLKIKEKVVSFFLHSFIPKQKLLALFTLPTSVFISWIKEIKFQCPESVLNKCYVKVPNQATLKEVTTIKTLLSDDSFRHWPIVSIRWYALRNKLCSLSLSSWYSYAKILGFDHRNRNHRKKKYAPGIRSSQPNELWHADVTLIKTTENHKAYIYLFMDNFSRCIISWAVSLYLSAKQRFATIVDAYSKTTDNPDVQLLVDGGSENSCDTSVIPVRKIIAQQDIHFSNSMIEAVNKVLKYRYLFKKQYHSITELTSELDKAIIDYNTKRPHYALHGLTPQEAYEGKVFSKSDYSLIIQQGMKQRIAYNQSYPCCFEDIVKG